VARPCPPALSRRGSPELRRRHCGCEARSIQTFPEGEGKETGHGQAVGKEAVVEKEWRGEERESECKKMDSSKVRSVCCALAGGAPRGDARACGQGTRDEGERPRAEEHQSGA
jgi:hypothetical protein